MFDWNLLLILFSLCMQILQSAYVDEDPPRILDLWRLRQEAIERKLERRRDELAEMPTGVPDVCAGHHSSINKLLQGPGC